MNDRLAEILAAKRDEVRARKAACPRPGAHPDAPRGFHAALVRARANGGTGLIAEVKRASPSRGLIRADFDPAAHARDYAAGGAACLSVLTDETFFGGSIEALQAARAACALPVLRKDFMVDPWQVAEARAMGADAILIIVAALSDAAMVEIEAAAIESGLDVLVEVHDADEMARAHALRSRLIGVNNRNLKDFTVDPARALAMAPGAPEGATLVAESGITGPADVADARRGGIDCFLVGEALMRADDVRAATRAMVSA